MHAGNLLQLHPDLPAKWDAWDVDHTYRRTVTDLTEVDTLEQVPGDAAVRVVRRFGRSTVTQVISLAPGSGRVDIDTEVDWHESETFLKAAFPLDVRAERSAAETQFGYVYRATDTNTSWEAAKFEICAHRYLHVAEPGFGVALVNDSTYGHDVTRTVRPHDGRRHDHHGAAVAAARAAVPGPGDRPGRAPDAATRWYRAPIWRTPPARATGSTCPSGGCRATPSSNRWCGSIDDGVVVSAVKLADDGSGDVVVRLYEALGARTAVRLDLGFTASAVTETDLLERPFDNAPAFDGTTAELDLRPFQVVTLRFSHPGGDEQ